MNIKIGLLGLTSAALLLLGCGDDSATASAEGSDTSDSSAETDSESDSDSAAESNSDSDSANSDSDSDSDSDDPPGDGDGDDPTTGDGDGDDSTTGDGDGDDPTTGDGDGDDPSGDGDGDDPTTGDGDGDDPGPDCTPQQASGVGPCDQFFGWAWNGATCVNVSGCECDGPDCFNLYVDLEECELAYADCQPAPPGCANLDQVQCEQSFECQPLIGSELIELPNDALCLDEFGYFACGSADFCLQALTWGCDGQDNYVLFSSSCMPEGWQPCDPPGDFGECP